MRFDPKYIVQLFLLALLWSCNKQQESGTDVQHYFFLRNAGADLPVTVQGNTMSKVLLLFLHGGPAQGGLYMSYEKGAYDDLRSKYGLVFYDQRGLGIANGTYDKEKLSLVQSVDDLRKLIQLLKYKYGEENRIFLIGKSWGGLLGTAFLLGDDNQAMVHGWIEIAGGHNYPLIQKEIVKMIFTIGQREVFLNRNTEEWRRLIQEVQGYDTTSVDFYRNLPMISLGWKAMGLMDFCNSYPNSPEDGEVLSQLFFSRMNLLTAFSNDFINLSGYYTTQNSMIDAYASSPYLYKITVPSRFFWGEYDFVSPPALAEDAYRHTGTPEKDKKKVIFPCGKHDLMASNRDEVVREIVSFVEKYR